MKPPKGVTEFREFYGDPRPHVRDDGTVLLQTECGVICKHDRG